MVNERYTAIFSLLRREIVFYYLGLTYKILEFTSKVEDAANKEDSNYIYYIELYIYISANGRYVLIENPSGDLKEIMEEVIANE